MRPETVYVGVDINDKSNLDNTDQNIFTLKTSSSNTEEIWDFIQSKGVTQIDLLFIDGWHSINQCLAEWEFTRWLAPSGVVMWHDTTTHPGPYLFVKHLDRAQWHVIENACAADAQDFGMGVAWRRND